MEEVVDIANPAAGVRGAPAFEPSSGGALAMRNYLVETDNELIQREGYVVDNTHVIHINSDGRIDYSDRQTGPIVVVEGDTSNVVFRLPMGASWVLETDRLFFTVPPQGHGFDPSGYWVDLAVEQFSDDTIYRWSSNTDAMGDAQRPDRDRVVPSAIYKEGSNRAPIGLSHPLIFGLTSTAPNSDNPIEMVFKVGVRSVRFVQVSIKVDQDGQDDTFAEFFRAGQKPTWAANQVYALEWRGTDAKFHTLQERAVHFLADNWLWVFGGAVGAAVDYFWVPDPEPLEPSGSGTVEEITQEQFENTYLEVEYWYDVNDGPHKFRYYLHGHRNADTGADIATSIQAGLSVGQLGAQVAGPWGAAAGAAVAAGGIASTLIGRATEGQRVALTTNLNTPLIEGAENTGFQVGQYVFCHTYSFDADRFVESLPSRTTEFVLHDFENIKQASRTLQDIQFKVKRPSKSSLFNWANYINIYAARTSNSEADDELAQGLGLDFQLIRQVAISDIDATLGLNVHWIDEELPEVDDYLESTDNDLPTRTLDKIVSYGSRIWGIDEFDQTIRYSKLGPYGYHYFPNDNALVPQNIALDKSESPIVKIHPAPNDSMLYVFKSDTIHFLRGHGEIRGLNNPRTPIDVDLDASVRKDNVGTSYPRSVTTLKDQVIFLGSDRILYSMSGMSVSPFALSIQSHIDKYGNGGYTDLSAENVIAFEYRNCYHLCLPNEVIVLDLQKRYWTIFDWEIEDIFWLQGVQNTLYAMIDNRLVRLYEGNDDAGTRIDCEWESNPQKLPLQGVISGVYVFHDETNRGQIQVSYRVNNGPYQTRTFTPAAYNRFRQGMHAQGHRVQIKIRDENAEKLRIDRIQVGVEV